MVTIGAFLPWTSLLLFLGLVASWKQPRSNMRTRITWLMATDRGVNGSALYSSDDIRLRGGKQTVLLPKGMDPTLSKAEQIKLAQMESIRNASQETQGPMSDLELLRENLKRLLERM